MRKQGSLGAGGAPARVVGQITPNNNLEKHTSSTRLDNTQAAASGSPPGGQVALQG